MRKYRKTFNGYFGGTYSGMKHRIISKKQYFGLELMDKMEWKEFLEDTIEDRKVLWEEWVASGYQLRMAPTIDRIDVSQGYIRNNVRWLSQWENSGLRRASTRKGAKLDGYCSHPVRYSHYVEENRWCGRCKSFPPRVNR